MPRFKLLASREIFYEFEVDSDSPENAEILVKEIALNESIEKYAYDWAPLDIFDNEESQ